MNYEARRTEALHGHEVPTDFGKWPPAEQEVLIKLAEASEQATSEQAARLSKMKPAIGPSLERDVRRVRAFCEALRQARDR
jgi:hypothetical protein